MTEPDRFDRSEVGLGLDTGTSVSPGSGAQFAILPPQNASGNWVKVVHPVVDIEISSEIVASPDFAPYLSFELIYTVAVECALPGLTEVPVSNPNPTSDRSKRSGSVMRILEPRKRPRSAYWRRHQADWHPFDDGHGRLWPRSLLAAASVTRRA